MPDRFGVEATLKEMPGEAVPTVETLCIVAAQQLHPTRDRPGGNGDHEMEVIRHQAPRMHPPARGAAHILEQLEETLAVFVIRENRLTAIAAARDVADPR
jgi:hypothetical protein